MKQWIKFVSVFLVFCMILSHVSMAETIVYPVYEYEIIDPELLESTETEEEEEEAEAEEPESGGKKGGNDVVYIAVGAVAVVGLVWYILWRRKKANKETTLYMDANLPMIQHPLSESVSLTLDSPFRQRLSPGPTYDDREPDVRDLYAVQVGMRIAF